MMFKIGKFQVLILGVFLSILLFSSTEVKAEQNKAAVIYDTYNEFGSEENKLNSLVQIILKNGKDVDIINVASYSKDLIDKYEVIFVLYNNSSELPKSFIQDLSQFKGKIVWIGKNFTESLEGYKNIKHISSFSSKDESYSELDKYINKFINNKEAKQENVYLLIDKVYPFIDLNNFVAKIDFLYEQGIPFICSVMPVYENQDFDAMKRFCEVLRYAQDKGGKIILHSSMFYGDAISGKDVKNKMDLAEQVYLKYGVYPLALDVPEGFLYKEDYKNLIYSSTNLFIEKDEKMGILDLQKYSIGHFEKIIEKVDIKDEHRYKFIESTHNIAFTFNSDIGLDTFKSDVNQLIAERVSFSDAERLDSVMKLGGMELSCKGSNILLNNKPINVQAETSKPQIESKNKNIDMGTVNGEIVKITGVICVFFVIVVLISLKIDRRKFFDYRG